MSLKVLQITPFFPPDRGGIQTYVRGLAEGLVFNGVETTVLTTSSRSGYPTDGETVYEIIRCPRDIVFFKGLISVSLFSQILHETEFDVCHVHIPFPLGLEVAALHRATHGTPLVATHHGEGFFGSLGYRVLRRSYWALSSSVSYQLLNSIVFLSRSYASSLRLPVGIDQRIRIVPGGVDTDRFSPSKASQEIRASAYRHAEFVILLVASLSKFNRYKGVDVLLRSFAVALHSGRNALLAIIGEGPLRRVYETLAKSLGISNSVYFAGEVSDEELPALIASADAFVMPSVRGPESYGLAVLEAMSSGVPPIVTNLPGISELVYNRSDGLVVEAGNTHSLCKAIELIRDDEILRKTLSINARIKALERTWNQVAQKMARVYTEVIP